MSTTARLEDFGQKIGGARKDLYNFAEFTEEERLKLVKRDTIWKKPDYVALIESGYDDGVAYYADIVRKSVRPHPDSFTDAAIKNYIDTVTSIRDDVMALKTKSDVDDYYIKTFLPKFFNKGASAFSFSVRDTAMLAISQKTMKAVMTSYGRCKRKAQSELFGVADNKKAAEKVRRTLRVVCVNGTSIKVCPDWYGKECIHQKLGSSSYYYYLDNHDTLSDKVDNETFVILNEASHRVILSENGKAFSSRDTAESAIDAMAKAAEVSAQSGTDKQTSRKSKFKSVCVQNVVRSGALDYLAGERASGDLYIETFGFRGGEFGHWMNEKDRQDSLDYGYNALMDLSVVLDIFPEDISLGKSLAIAFGARGKGAANAHFETLRNVINLTKMSGAGCLAHEWCHALDFYIGKKCNVKPGALASDSVDYFCERAKLPKPFADLVIALKIDSNTKNTTEYYRGSTRFGEMYAKTGHGYWESRCEMLARAFDCYVHDKLAELGIRSDYLSAYSDSFKMGDTIAYPVGKERRMFNQKFDELFAYLRTDGFFR